MDLSFHEEMLHDEIYNNMGSLRGCQSMGFISEVMTKSLFLCPRILYQNHRKSEYDFFQKEKGSFYQIHRDEKNENSNIYIPFSESISDQDKANGQKVPISPSVFPKNCQQYHINNPRNELTTRQKFTKEEDELLIEMVNTYGAKKWSRIASKIPGRTPRQCRDRYANYLQPGFRNSEWSLCEDILLVEKYTEFGSQWTLISHFFQGRTPNSIKNRWKYNVSRRVDSLLSQKKNDIFKVSKSCLNDLKSDENEKFIIPLEVNLKNKINESNFLADGQKTPSLMMTKKSTESYPSVFTEGNSMNAQHQNNYSQKASSESSMTTSDQCDKSKKGITNNKAESFLENSEIQLDSEDDKDDIWPLQYFDDEELFGTVSIFS